MSKLLISLLAAAGLPELVTESRTDFETLAIKLANDAKALKALRGKVAKCRNSSLFDTAAFTKNIESAYRAMWERWLAGEKSNFLA